MFKRKYNENLTVRRKNLYTRIRKGNVAIRLYNRYIYQGKEYRLTNNSSKYVKYVFVAVSYSLYVLNTDWDCINRE